MRFCPLFSGSSGNCLYLEAGDTRLLIDAGLPGRTVEQALSSIGVAPSSLSGILVTHEHRDHVSGVGVLSRKYGLPVFANANCFMAMNAIVGKIAPENLRVIQTDCDFYLGGLSILPFSTPHDAVEPVGYRFCYHDITLTTMTDIGWFSDTLFAHASGSDLLLIEANHDVEMLMAGRYTWPLKQRILSRHGHLSNEDCGRALCRLYTTGVRNVILGHLSGENNTEDIAHLCVESALRQEQIYDMQLFMAHRDRPCAVFTLE
ncbi:MAG: MBL fold metallo-hydrolase [Eubacteriales bacterium]|nr:MBL fold metallo-hydrolase [Eubacteriales bacterium]